MKRKRKVRRIGHALAMLRTLNRGCPPELRELIRAKLRAIDRGDDPRQQAFPW